MSLTQEELDHIKLVAREAAREAINEAIKEGGLIRAELDAAKWKIVALLAVCSFGGGGVASTLLQKFH